MVGRAAPVLRACMTDTGMLAATLRAVQFTAFARLTLSASGVEIATEANQVVQAHAYLYASVFDAYEFAPPPDWRELASARQGGIEDDQVAPCVVFEIHAKTLVACLAVVESRVASAPPAKGPRPAIELVYEGVGEPLCLRVQDERLSLSFKLRTLDAPLATELALAPTGARAQVIMKSSYLAPALQELSTGGETTLSLSFVPSTPGPGRLALRSDGSYGSTEIDFPHDMVVTEKFVCASLASHAYPIECVGYMTAALRYSTKTSLRVDAYGMLSAQFMIAGARSQRAASVPDSGHAFVEFICCPLDTRPAT